MSLPPSFPNDDIKLGIYINPWVVKLDVVGGKFLAQHEGCLELGNKNEECFDKAKTRSQPIYISENIPKLVVNSIPAADVIPKYDEDNEESKNLPEIIKKPLIKTENGKIEGRRSGGRSALLCLENDYWVRMKGCGNYVDQDGFRFDFPGFPIREYSVFGEVIGRELRGCCEEHNAYREQYYSNMITNIMKEEGLVPGNSPLGVWEYDIEIDPTKEAVKHCALFRTYGERRLASHLLNGLDQLLGLFICQSTDNEALKERLLSREPENSNDSSDDQVVDTWKALYSGNRKRPINFFNDKSITDNFETLLDTYPNQLTEEYKEHWLACVNGLLDLSNKDNDNNIDNNNNNNNNNNNVSLFLQLYSKIGYECGKYARMLKDNNILWGYFFDHNPTEPHCNAHPNNYIILPPASENDTEGRKNQLLSILDNDMSMTLEEFLNPYTGNHYPEEDAIEMFNEWKKSEENELRRALAGEIANNGLIGLDNGTKEPNVKWALRDTLIHYFELAYNKEDNPNPINDLGPLHTLIQLGLMQAHFAQS